jgi:hypothetical protein
MCVRVGEVINRTAIEMKLMVMQVSEDLDERRCEEPYQREREKGREH